MPAEDLYPRTAALGAEQRQAVRIAALEQRIAALERALRGALTLAQIPDPDAPADGEVRIYARDFGGGRTALSVKFADGSSVDLGVEP